MQPTSNAYNLIDYSLLPHRVGDYTRSLLKTLSNPRALDVKAAKNELGAELTPLSDRLCDYISNRFNVANTEKAVRKVLNDASKEKNLDLSTQAIGSWFISGKYSINISSKNLFRLCLALNLNLEESAHFVYDCLYLNWFNCRNLEESIYIIFIGMQDIFGVDTYSTAEQLIKEYKSKQQSEVSGNNEEQNIDATGYTRILSNDIQSLLLNQNNEQEGALNTIKVFLDRNLIYFSGLQRSAVHVYKTYLTQGAIGIESFAFLYQKTMNLDLPETTYLDMAEVRSSIEEHGAEQNAKGKWFYIDEYGETVFIDLQRKHLLWGTLQRPEFLEKNDRDCDLLNTNDIKIERHEVTKILESGIPRGNIIALLFFHFCLENAAEIKKESLRAELFERFYEMTNETLTEECGMMPLHPRKPFDRLFLMSLSQTTMNPVDYLNTTLENYYA